MAALVRRGLEPSTPMAQLLSEREHSDLSYLGNEEATSEMGGFLGVVPSLVRISWGGGRDLIS